MPRKKTICARRRGHQGDCNTALGYIEGMAELAQAYLGSPPARLPDVRAA
jgi:hypothetical protein